MKQTSKKVRKLNRYEKALLTLAELVEMNPFCGYKVQLEVADILGLTLLPAKKK